MNKFASTSLLEATKSSLENAFPPSPKVVVGVSGGPDSMALLYLFYKLKVDAFVVHVNYRLRGENSDAEQELVEGMSTAWGFECCSIRLDSKPETGNFQKWAREQRYQIFQDFKTELNADAIATAHHQDDQIETIFQKVIRGSGPASWQGMQLWDGTYFRPLLSFSKPQILQFCETEAIPYRVDESNLESKYARNFFRNELVSQLDERFPGWKDNILGLQEYGSLLHDVIHEELKKVGTDSGISISELKKMPESLQKAVLKQFVEEGTSGSISRGQVEELFSVLGLQVGKEATISEEYSLLRGREELSILHKQGEKTDPILIREDEIRQKKNFHSLFFDIKNPEDFSDSILQLDKQKMEWPLTLRHWQNGDGFQPLGMGGTQKVSDHLTNKKIPTKKRTQALILSGAGGTIYALIYPDGHKVLGAISESVKVTNQTGQVLRVSSKE